MDHYARVEKTTANLIKEKPLRVPGVSPNMSPPARPNLYHYPSLPLHQPTSLLIPLHPTCPQPTTVPSSPLHPPKTPSSESPSSRAPFTGFLLPAIHLLRHRILFLPAISELHLKLPPPLPRPCRSERRFPSSAFLPAEAPAPPATLQIQSVSSPAVRRSLQNLLAHPDLPPSAAAVRPQEIPASLPASTYLSALQPELQQPAAYSATTAPSLHLHSGTAPADLQIQ